MIASTDAASQTTTSWFPRAPVEYEYPADLPRLGGSRNYRAVAVHIEEHDIADGVVVPYIVLDLLLVPLERATVHIKCDDAVAVEVVSLADRAAEIGVWGARAEDEEPELRVDQNCAFPPP